MTSWAERISPTRPSIPFCSKQSRRRMQSHPMMSEGAPIFAATWRRPCSRGESGSRAPPPAGAGAPPLAAEKGAEVLELEGAEAERGLEDREDGGVALERSIPVDPGPLEPEVVAGRAPDDGHVPERLVQGRREGLLGEREPVDEDEPERPATAGEIPEVGPHLRGHRQD